MSNVLAEYEYIVKLADEEDTGAIDEQRAVGQCVIDFLAEIRAQAKTILELQARVQRLQNTVLENIEEIKTLKARVAELEKELAFADSDVAAKRSYIEELEREMAVAKRLDSEQFEQIEKLKERVAELGADAAFGRMVRVFPEGAAIKHAHEPWAEWIADWPRAEANGNHLIMNRAFGDTPEAAITAARGEEPEEEERKTE
jgi:predicted RNase H-like nuclease (RuvC/YqgF family)